MKSSEMDGKRPWLLALALACVDFGMVEAYGLSSNPHQESTSELFEKLMSTRVV